MRVLSQWILPIAMGVIGIAIFTGLILRDLPASTGLRPIIGMVAILLGAHRFVVSRIKQSDEERRFGGSSRRPWE